MTIGIIALTLVILFFMRGHIAWALTKWLDPKKYVLGRMRANIILYRHCELRAPMQIAQVLPAAAMAKDLSKIQDVFFSRTPAAQTVGTVYAEAVNEIFSEIIRSLRHMDQTGSELDPIVTPERMMTEVMKLVVVAFRAPPNMNFNDEDAIETVLAYVEESISS